MDNSYNYFISGTYKEAELEVSLKSCVPFFIAYPELILGDNYQIEDVVPYYKPEIDYNDHSIYVTLEHNKVEEGKTQKFINAPGQRDYSNNKVLGIIFESLMRRAVNAAIVGDSNSDPTPLLSVLIDIGSDSSRQRVIKVPSKDVDNFDTLKESLHTYSDHITANLGNKLTRTQKSNLLLLNMLLSEFNDLGTTGGRH